MIFGLVLVHKNVCSEQEFSRYQYIDSHTTLKGVNYFLPAISYLLSDTDVVQCTVSPSYAVNKF